MYTPETVIDVTSAAPAGTPDTTGGAASSAAVETPAQPTGDVTAAASESQQAPVSTAEGSTPPPSTEDDPLQGIPTVDELRQQVEQKVPYAAGLLQVRTALEALKAQHEPLQQQFEPWKPIVENYSSPEEAQMLLDVGRGLFTEVVENGVPKIGEDGLPVVTTLPGLQKLEEYSPGIVDQVFADLMSLRVDDGTGQVDTMSRHYMRSLGLNPDRLSEYQKIDELRTPTFTGAVDPKDLESIPANLHEAFKSLPPDVREDLKAMDVTLRDFHLNNRREALEGSKFRTQWQQQQQETQRQAEVQRQQQVVQAAQQYVAQARKETHDSIRNSLASQWVPSGDPATQEAVYSVVMGSLTTLLDPQLRFSMEPALKALGVTLDSTFDTDISRFEERTETAKKYEAMGQLPQARAALADAGKAREKIAARLNVIAGKVAKALSGQTQQNAQRNGNLLSQATITRPTAGNGGAPEAHQGILPAGVSPLSPDANTELARRAGLLK